MSSRYAPFLKVRVRVKRKVGRGFRLPLPPVALYVPYQAVLSFDGLAAFWPAGLGGNHVRAALEALLTLLCQLIRYGPYEYVRVDVKDANADVSVHVRTW